jgi:uncharacterized protein YjbI with pentapeptide repeats
MMMRIALGLAVAVLALSPSLATSGGLPSYTQPNAGADASGEPQDDKLSARDVTARLFKAASGSQPDLTEFNLTRLDLAELDFKHSKLDGSDLYGARPLRLRISAART